MEKIWLKNYDYFVPETIKYPRIPLYQVLEYGCLLYEDNVATIFFDQKMTYSELKDNVRRMATALKGMGVKKGDRVALMLPNCPQMIISYFGVLEAGAVVANISPLHVEREIEYELNDSGSETLIYLDLFHSRIEAVRESSPLRRTIITGITDYMETPVDPAASKGPNDYWFREVIAEASAEAPDPDEIDPAEDLAALQYTGGTTGLAKGVMLTHRNLFANVMQIGSWAKEFIQRGKDMYLCVIPFFHSYGQSVCMNNAIFNASTMLLMPQFEINMMLQALESLLVVYEGRASFRVCPWMERRA